MALTKDDGLKRLAAAQELTRSFRQRFKPNVDVPPDALVDTALADTEALPRTVLRLLRVIATSRGRAGPAVVLADGGELPVLKAADVFWRALVEEDGRVTTERFEELRKGAELTDDDATRGAGLLKELGLAVGVRRAGGLRRSDVAASDVVAALAKAKEAPQPAKPGEDVSGEHVYYEPCASLVESWEGYEVTILGRQQIGRGEWSTPDVVGLLVEEAPSLIVPIARVASVEVKLELSRLAIAEATAHKRFAHYAYVGVPQAPADMDPTLVTELVRAGLGLLCPRQRGSVTFHLYVDAAFNQPNEEEVEFFLSQFDSSPGVSMTKSVHDRVRAAMKVLFQ